ncbi:MAG: DUF2256 domain-containing protein [Phototrophicales bacterium]|nr:MAG: DUF2256 domain-containing protein [Phototrophicales bacterium]
MSKNIKKENLPQKICPICNRPFAWRKKWEKQWDNIKYCSDKCRKQSRQEKQNDKKHAP